MMMSSAQRETGGPDTDACEWTRGYAAFEGPAATAAALPPYTQAYVHNVNTFKRVPLFEVTQITNGPLYLYYDGFQLYATTTYHHDQSFHPYVLRANGGREPWTTTRKLLLSTAPREKGTPVFDGDVVVVPTVAGGTTTYTIAHTAAASSSMDIPGHADVDALRHQALQGAWSLLASWLHVSQGHAALACSTVSS